MSTISEEYVKTIPQIYKDIFGALWMFNPRRKKEQVVPIQSLKSVLHDKYSLGEIQRACDNMVEKKVLEVTNDEFYSPTELGEKILKAVQEENSIQVESFPLPPGE